MWEACRVLETAAWNKAGASLLRRDHVNTNETLCLEVVSVGKVRMAVRVQSNVPHNWTRVQESCAPRTLSLTKIIHKSKPYAYKGKGHLLTWLS